MRFRIIYSYDGSKFFGYQKQPRKRTVQNELEKVLKIINGNKKVSVYSSGRTDSKVHALRQNAHFDLQIKICPNKLIRALNSLLPEDIYIKDCIKVNEDFNARFDVKKKEYLYKINTGEYNPIEKDYVYQLCKKIDIRKMKKAASHLIGENNYKAFVKVDEPKETYVRKIYKIKITKNKNYIEILFIGNGFMRYMVRNIVGTLIDVGSGKTNVNEIKKILLSKDRRKAGKCAYAGGLYLKDVIY